MSDDLRAAVEASDSDALIRIVDGACVARDWDRLLLLRRLCAEAASRGKQLWGVDEHVRYRLALEAPAPLAVPAVAEGPARFTLGPLPEVVASSHPWSDLDPHLEPGTIRTVVAHERVARGDDLTGTEGIGDALELPLRLEDWEPAYPTATYHPDKAEYPPPDLPGMDWTQLPEPSVRTHDPSVIDALERLVEPWTSESNGHVEVVSVEGSALGAIRALGPTRVGVSRLTPSAALAWMGWAGASGGAHGRRRGAAGGRFAAWWAAHELAGVDWPPHPAHLGESLHELTWWLWTDGDDTGWRLRIAVEDPEHGMAWAMVAVDGD